MRRLLVVSACLLFAGCAPSGGSTANEADSFSGAKQDVAASIDDFSTAVRKSDEKEICNSLLARDLVRKLDAAPGRCQEAISHQLDAANDPKIDVKTITIAGNRAQARVVSTYDGDDRTQTLLLVDEGNRWRLSGLGR